MTLCVCVCEGWEWGGGGVCEAGGYQTIKQRALKAKISKQAKSIQ